MNIVIVIIILGTLLTIMACTIAQKINDEQ